MSDSNSCDINAKGSCCSNPDSPQENKDLQVHWDNAYAGKSHEKLGWFETDLSPMLSLIEETKTPKSSRVINIGAGSTVLIDELLTQGFNHLIATDISEVALTNLKNRVNSDGVEFITDDLTHPTTLKNIDPVDLWIDRAVLHFFTEQKDQNTYFDLLKSKVKKNGFVIFAEFGLGGAKKCSGLDVHRYGNTQFQEQLGNEFELLNTFDYSYSMPSGDLREYIYSLFIRV